ncbi:hypothetical protein EDF59_1021 [Novosphingobium sp. ST904]|nr:hypothetical protein EDF59_1021 [Novosphingobium sp. ST904]
MADDQLTLPLADDDLIRRKRPPSGVLRHSGSGLMDLR